MVKEVKNFSKINDVSLGIAGGILFGACMLLMTLFGILFSGFSTSLGFLVGSYGFLGRFGYDVSWFGLLLGTIYGFIEGFLFFWILGLLYNRLR